VYLFDFFKGKISSLLSCALCESREIPFAHFRYTGKERLFCCEKMSLWDDVVQYEGIFLCTEKIRYKTKKITLWHHGITSPYTGVIPLYDSTLPHKKKANMLWFNQRIISLLRHLFQSYE
jgi:hypothetical protein